MARQIDLNQRTQRVFFEAMLTDSLPDDYVLEAHELIIALMQQGKPDEEIVNSLCAYFKRPNHDLNPELARVLLHKTKSRWTRYLSKYADEPGKTGRPKFEFRTFWWLRWAKKSQLPGTEPIRWV